MQFKKFHKKAKNVHGKYNLSGKVVLMHALVNMIEQFVCLNYDNNSK